jgi:hypothetical protein
MTAPVALSPQPPIVASSPYLLWEIARALPRGHHLIVSQSEERGRRYLRSSVHDTGHRVVALVSLDDPGSSPEDGREFGMSTLQRIRRIPGERWSAVVREYPSGVSDLAALSVASQLPPCCFLRFGCEGDFARSEAWGPRVDIMTEEWMYFGVCAADGETFHRETLRLTRQFDALRRARAEEGNPR